MQISGDESLDDHGARGVLFIQHAFVEQCLDAVPGKKRTDLVPGQQLHFAALCSNCHAHAIAIGIGGDDEISALRFRKFDRQC